MAGDVDPLLVEAVRRVGQICAALPETREEDAWVGVRWRVRMHTIAHVTPIREGRPEGYAQAAGLVGTGAVLVFHAEPEEAQTFAHLGWPWFKPDWSRTVVGLVLEAGTDWSEVAELVTDSYCLKAPQKLARLVERPPG